MSRLALHQPGEIVRDRYQIDSVLGQGAIGTTYGATDLQGGGVVALKVLSVAQMQDWKALELFEREAATLATLDHPAIPHYLEHFHLDTERDRRFYLVQEYIAGQSLETLIRNGQAIAEAEVQAIALQALEILDYLHSREPAVIHRDIKPQNVIYTVDSRIVLVDFGAVQEAFRHTLSRGGTFVGTVDYMPPEQFRGQATFASDLYSLGITLIDLLTGPTPISDIPEKRLKLDFQSVVAVSPDFAAWLERLIEPAIEDRFQSTPAARQALLAHSSPAESSPTGLTIQPANSRIILQRSPERLRVYLPAAPWRWSSSLLTLINVGLSLILGLFTLSVLFIILFSIANLLGPQASIHVLESLVGGILGSILLAFGWLLPALSWSITRHRLRGDRVELDLRPQGFRLKYRCFPLSRTVIGDLAALKLQLQPRRQGIKLLHLAETQRLRHSFWGWGWQSSKLFDYRFGQWFSTEEQVWLAGELDAFLKSAQAQAQPATSEINFDAPLPAPKPTSPSNRSSENSRLQITRWPDRFELSVPPMVRKNQAWLLWLVAIIGLSTFPLSFVGPLLILWHQPHLLWSLLGDFSLSIDAHQFRLQWRYLFWQHTVTGPTQQIQGIERHSKIRSHHQPMLICALITEHRPYLFGSWLQEHEKDRAIAELQAFLAQLPTSNSQ